MHPDNIKSELKSRVAKGLNFGIEAVEEVIDPASAVYNEYILLQSKYNDLMYVSAQNTLPYEQIELGLDRLRSNLLGLINRLDNASLHKKEMEAGMKVQALPTRRANFFQLIDIHFRNLEAIHYVEIYGDQETRKSGREAVFELYNLHRRTLRNREDVKGEQGWNALREYFREYFANEMGVLEVYFKNVKHLLAYTLESEVEQPFFLDTLRSLFSRFELGLVFYYALSGLDAELPELVRETRLVDESVRGILIDGKQLESFYRS